MERISRNQMIAKVSDDLNLDKEVVFNVLDSFAKTLFSELKKGNIVSLINFGVFRIHKHKGHKVNYKAKPIDDYNVLKFSASKTINKTLRTKKEE